MSISNAHFSIQPKSAEGTFRMAINGNQSAISTLALDLHSFYNFRLSLGQTTQRCTVQELLYKIGADSIFENVFKDFSNLGATEDQFGAIYSTAIQFKKPLPLDSLLPTFNPNSYIEARQAFIRLLKNKSPSLNPSFLDLNVLQTVLDQNSTLINASHTSSPTLPPYKQFSSDVIMLIFQNHLDLHGFDATITNTWLSHNSDKVYDFKNISEMAMHTFLSTPANSRMVENRSTT